MFIPSLSFVILPKKINKNGTTTIYLQYINNRKTNRLSCNIRIMPSQWSEHFIKEKGKNAHSQAKELNSLLRREMERAEKIVLNLLKERTLSFQKFKDRFLSRDMTSMSDLLNVYIKTKEKKITDSTIRLYSYGVQKLESYSKNCQILEIDIKFLQDLERHLKVNLELSQNTIRSIFVTLTLLMNFGLKRGIINTNPFMGYKLPASKKAIRPSISLENLEKLESLYNKNELSRANQRILKLYLIGCHTGISHVDILNLDYSDIHLIDNTYMIQAKRQKTKVKYSVVLNDYVLKMITPILSAGQVFKRVTTLPNAQLKAMFLKADMKVMTFHSSRHTFATLCLNKGIPIVVVQEMMGHSSILMTQHYAKINKDYIIQEMKKW